MRAIIALLGLFFLAGCGSEPLEPVDSDETFKLVKQRYGISNYPEGQRFKLIVRTGKNYGEYATHKFKSGISWSLIKKDFVDATNYEGVASCCSSYISFRNPEEVPPSVTYPKFRRVFIDAAWDGKSHSAPEFIDAVVESFDDEETVAENDALIAAAISDYKSARTAECEAWEALDQSEQFRIYSAVMDGCVTREQMAVLGKKGTLDWCTEQAIERSGYQPAPNTDCD